MAEQKGEVNHVLELDGIRGMAVLSVLLYHFHHPYLASRPLGFVSDVIARGSVGVDVFFVLSGFLITSILISTRDASNYFQAFYARRALRIFPLAFAMIAVFYWVALPLAHRHGLLPKLPESEQVWYWLFLGNWRQGLGLNDGAELGHFWTLAIEEQFYILFSLIARYVPVRLLPRVCLALIALSVGTRIWIAAAHGFNPDLIRLTPLHLEPLALGATLASSGGFLRWAARWRWALMSIGVAGLTWPLPAGLAILTSGLGASGLVGMAVTQPVPALRPVWLRRCGKYSYAMYLLQPAWAIAPLYKKHPGSVGLMLGALVLGPLVTYGMAVVSWNVLEKRMLALKRNFPYRIDVADDQLDRSEPRLVVPTARDSTPAARS